MNRRNKCALWLLAGSCLAAGGLGGLLWFLKSPHALAAAVTQLVAAALVLPSYWALGWALKRSNRSFYTVFLAGMLFRLAGFGLTALVFYVRAPRSLVAGMLSLAGGMTGLLFTEMYFSPREEKETWISSPS